MKSIITPLRLVLLGVVVVIGVCLYMLNSYAFLEIHATDQDFSYSITNQGNGSRSSDIAAGNTARKLVRRGDYEVLVQKAKQSYLSVQKTGGFFGTTRISAKLSPERARSFVGNNPGPCLYLLANQLASTACSGLVEEVGFHMPATNIQASYIKKAIGPVAEIEGLVKQASAAVFGIVRAEAETDGANAIHVAYSIDSTGVFRSEGYIEIPGLESTQTYTFTPYDAGYLAVDRSGTKFLYYTALNQKPSELPIKPPTDKSLVYRTTVVSSGAITVVYSNDTSSESRLQDPSGGSAHSRQLEQETTAKNPKSEIVVYTKNGTKKIVLQEPVIRAVACGQRICTLLASGRMVVYDATEKSKPVLAITNAVDVQHQGDALYVTTPDGVFQINIDTKEGYMVYSFGDFGYCGSTKQLDAFVICIEDKEGSRRALLIDREQENTDSIDEKIAKLASYDLIKTISAYGQFIHVSPEVGELTFQQSIGGFGYDPARRSQVASAIDAEVKRLGIDIGKYTIVNPLR